MDVFGQIQAPQYLAPFGSLIGGPGKFLTLIFRVLIMGGGIYSVFNIILAGYAFLSAGDDPKKIEGAWAKIWQTLIGLAFIAGSFVLAAIFGKLVFGDYNTIINPQIPTIQDINSPGSGLPNTTNSTNSTFEGFDADGNPIQ